jgi:hypothetical protein
MIKSAIKSIKTISFVQNRSDDPELKLRENYVNIYNTKSVSLPQIIIINKLSFFLDSFNSDIYMV